MDTKKKNRDFKLDFDNGFQIRQKKDAFKDFVKDYKMKVQLLDLAEQKKQKDKEDRENQMLEDKYYQLKEKLQNKNADTNKIEMEMWEIQQTMDNIAQKKENILKKPTKISIFQEDMEKVIYQNIKRLVDPNSNGAKKAIQENLKISESRRASPLPNINQRYQSVQPLTKIRVGYKYQDVNFIHFKVKHCVSPKKFQSQIKETIEESKEKKSNQLRLKINSSQETLAQIKSGGEIPFLQQKSPQSNSGAGLPIFQNQSYINNLEKLLNSKDLDECYDYEANDKSFRKLYECLNLNKTFQTKASEKQFVSPFKVNCINKKDMFSETGITQDETAEATFMTGIQSGINETSHNELGARSHRVFKQIDSKPSKTLNTSPTNVGEIMRRKIMQRNTFSKFTAVNSYNQSPQFDLKHRSILRIAGPNIQGGSNFSSPRLQYSERDCVDPDSKNLSYSELNNQLRYPNNPAYFQVQKIDTSTTKEAQLQKAQNDKQKNQTLLDFCREQGIAFTDIDKVMYSLQTSKELHHILTRFLEKDTKIVEDEPERAPKPKKVKRNLSFMNFDNLESEVGSEQKSSKKFQGPNIAFNKYGEFNKHLDEEEMIKYFEDVMDNRIKPPPRKSRVKTQVAVQDVDHQSEMQIIDEKEVENSLHIPTQQSPLSMTKKDSSFSIIPESPIKIKKQFIMKKKPNWAKVSVAISNKQKSRQSITLESPDSLLDSPNEKSRQFMKKMTTKFLSPQRIPRKQESSVSLISMQIKNKLGAKFNTISYGSNNSTKRISKIPSEIQFSEELQAYQQKNQIFKDGLIKLQNSIEEPSAREEKLKEIKMVELIERKQMVKENNDSEQEDQESETDSAKERFQKKIRDCDPVYGMLDACKDRFKSKQKTLKDANKLMERMELDRPILQREKFELIFLEKIRSLESSDQEHLEIQNFVANKIQIKLSEIRRAQTNRMKQRKQDNILQLSALKTMFDFIKTRFQVEKIRPLKQEIKLLEVFKKIVESGWIVGIPEIKQVVEFLGITRAMVNGKENYQYRSFLERILNEFKINIEIRELIQ